MRAFPLMAAELAHFAPAQRMRGWRAVLGAADVQGRGFEVDLFPTQVHHFGRSEAVPIGQKHHQRVAMTVAVLPDCSYFGHSRDSRTAGLAYQFGVSLPER